MTINPGQITFFVLIQVRSQNSSYLFFNILSTIESKVKGNAFPGIPHLPFPLCLCGLIQHPSGCLNSKSVTNVYAGTSGMLMKYIMYI